MENQKIQYLKKENINTYAYICDTIGTKLYNLLDIVKINGDIFNETNILNVIILN